MHNNNYTDYMSILKTIIVLATALTAGTNAAGAQTLKQWRDSLNTINNKIDNHPDSLPLQLEKAAVNLQLLEWEDAIEACGKVLSKDPVNLTALYYRAYANNNLRRYRQAAADYETFLSMSPRNMEARLGLAYTYIKTGDNTDALDQLNNLVEMYPDSAVTYAARAELEKDMQMYEPALYDLDRALEHSPANSDYVESKVEILLQLGRKREAREALDSAIRAGVPRGLLRQWYNKCK